MIIVDEKRAIRSSSSSLSMQRYMANLVTPLYSYVQFNETENDSHLLIYTRVSALTWACKLNIGDCVSSSVNLYRAWMNDPSNST